MRNSKHKKELIIAIVLVLVIGVFYLVSSQDSGGVGAGYKNTSYVVGGQSVTLVDGFSEIEVVPDSESKITTSYFGNELMADLNGDGREDVVFILTQETGGSGVFYYVVSAINTGEGYLGSESYFLGDRVAPQTIEMSREPDHKDVIVVNYMDREASEPMSSQPSVGESVWLKINPQTLQFGVVEKDFEGEADSSRMSLTMGNWTWISALYNDGHSIAQDRIGDFVLSFDVDGTFFAKTDCNSMSGNYFVDEHSLSFGPIAMTKMFCPDSKESEFAKILEGTAGYIFTSKGELILELKFDSGTATFKIVEPS